MKFNKLYLQQTIIYTIYILEQRLFLQIAASKMVTLQNGFM